MTIPTGEKREEKVVLALPSCDVGLVREKWWTVAD